MGDHRLSVEMRLVGADGKRRKRECWLNWHPERPLDVLRMVLELAEESQMTYEIPDERQLIELWCSEQPTAAPEPEYHPSGATWKEAYQYANNDGLHWDGTGWRKATATPEPTIEALIEELLNEYRHP